MHFTHRRAEIIFGAFFGAWIGAAYAFASQAVNWLFLPGIPLETPSGSLSTYFLEYLVMGALLGCICTLPENRWGGVALGGVSSALLLTYRTLSASWGGDNFGPSLVLTLLMFLPLVVMMMPMAFLIRLGADARQVNPDKPYLWPRQYLIPIILTLVVVGIGCLSLYSTQSRAAFRYMDQMVHQGLIAASSGKELPVPLQDVKNFGTDARGSYSLAWSDRVDTFYGPVPVGTEMSQFLIITRFENGFTFACVFSDNRSVPNCTNY